MRGVGPNPISESEHRWRELPESALDAIVEFDGGWIVLLNRMAEQLLRCPGEEPPEQTIEELPPTAVCGAHKRHRNEYLNEPVTRPMVSGVKLEACRKDGSRFPVEISLSPVKSNTGLRVTAIIRDISERRQMEDQLRAVEEQYIHELELRNRKQSGRTSSRLNSWRT